MSSVLHELKQSQTLAEFLMVDNNIKGKSFQQSKLQFHLLSGDTVSRSGSSIFSQSEKRGRRDFVTKMEAD